MRLKLDSDKDIFLDNTNGAFFSLSAFFELSLGFFGPL